MRTIQIAMVGLGLAVLLMNPPAAGAAAADVAGDVAAAGTASAVVVISEFAHSGFGSTDEYLELYNITNQFVSLDGWELWACLSFSFPVLLAVFGETDVIIPDGHLLLAHMDSSTGPSDLVYGGVDVPDDGGWLVSDWWSGQFDAVGLREGVACTEGGPAPECDWAAGEAVTRDEQGRDTDDNSADFTCQARTPGF